MQPVVFVHQFTVALGVSASVKQGVVELSIIGDGPHNGFFGFGLDVIDYVYILGVGVDDPVETVKSVWTAGTAFAVFIFGDQYAVIGAKGIVADPLDDFQRVKIVGRIAG